MCPGWKSGRSPSWPGGGEAYNFPLRIGVLHVEIVENSVETVENRAAQREVFHRPAFDTKNS